MDKKELHTYVLTEWYKNVPILDPTQIHFDVGDRAWVSYVPFEAEPVIITSIQDFGEGAFKYYYFEYDNKPNIFVRLFHTIRFYLHTWKILRGIYFPPDYLGPGHGELAGAGNVLHKNKQEAIEDYLFFITEQTLIYLDDHKPLED